MSEDRLERALDDMKAEDMHAEQIEAARARVWENVANAGSAVCAEFRPEFRAYLSNELGASRRLLVEDHLSRCPSCRTRVAAMKGERTVIAMPAFAKATARQARWVRRGMLAAAAGLLFALVYVGRDTIDGMMAPGGPPATVVSTEGALYRLAAWSADLSAKVEAGAAIGDRESVRTGPGARVVLRLADRIDCGCQRAHGTVCRRCVERSLNPPATRRHHRHGRQTTPRTTAGVDARFDRLCEGNHLRGVRRRRRLGGIGHRGIGGGEPAWKGARAESRRSGRVDPGALELDRASRRVEPRFRIVLGGARVVRQDRARAGEFPARAAEQLSSAAISPCAVGHLRRGPESQASQSAGPWPSPSSSRPGMRRSACGGIPTRDRQLRQIADRIQSVSPLLGDEIVFCVSFVADSEAVPMLMARVQPGKRPAARDDAATDFRRGGRDPVVFDFRRLVHRVRLAGAPVVGRCAPGTGRRLSLCGCPQRAVSTRRGLGDRDGRILFGHDCGGRGRAAARARWDDGYEVRIPRAACSSRR